MKTDKTYKMSKPIKTMLNMMLTDEQKPVYQKLFVEAGAHEIIIKKKMSVKMIVETEEE